MAVADLDTLRGLAVALGLGLLVGMERERRLDAGQGIAGVRTFALIALAGALAERIGGVGIAVGGAFVVLATLASYRASRERDPGLTTETAMLVVFLLGVLAMRELVLAAGLGVAVALPLGSVPVRWFTTTAAVRRLTVPVASRTTFTVLSTS